MAIQFFDDPNFATNLGRALGSGVQAGTQAYQSAREAKLKQDRELAAAQNFGQILQGLGGGGGMQGVNFAALTPDQMKFATDLTFRQMESEKKREQLERHHQEKSTQQAWKAAEKTIGEARTNYEASREESNGIYKMMALEKTNKLDSPAKAAILQKLGFDWMLDPTSQAFNKQNAAFQSGASKLGADVSNFKLQSHMKRYPSLMMSKGGRELVYDDILNTNALNEKYYKTMQKIIKESGGKPPDNLRLLTDEKMQPTYDKYRQKLMDRIDKAEKLAPLPEDTSAGANSFEKDFPPAQFDGETIEDNGQLYFSNGKKWDPVTPEEAKKLVSQQKSKPAAPVPTSPNLPPIDFDTFLNPNVKPDRYGVDPYAY